MKTFKALVLGLLLTVCSSVAFAQQPPLNEPDYNKPQLFADWPQRVALSPQAIENLLGKTTGSSVRLTLLGNLVLEGQVISASKSTDTSYRTVVVRSTNRAGAMLTLTRRQTPTGISYIGRIISRANSDAFQLVEEDGVYYLRKTSFYELVSE